jgi:hypothetical protein
MTTIAELWLPILVSSVLVFIASSIIWMALPIHKKDYNELPNEAGVMAAMKTQNVKPGIYVYPWAQCAKSPDPAAIERAKTGPWGQVLVAPRAPTMGWTLGLWFLHIVVLSVFIAYVAGISLPRGAEYLKVFQVAGAAAFLGYVGGLLPRFIWEGKPWSILPGAMFDAVVYTLLTAGAFGWLWPVLIQP